MGCITALGGGNTSLGQNQIIPSATIIRDEGYKVLGESSAETSTFFFLGLFPVTNPLNIEYAMSQAVQKIPGGDSMVEVYVWKETQNVFPLGSISVLKVKGTVVSFKKDEQAADENKTKTIKKSK